MRLAAHRIALRPTRTQVDHFRRACGVARFAYNWGLAEWQRMHAAGERPSWMTVTKRLRAVQDELFPWMREVTKFCPELALQNLGAAFVRFFEWVKGGRKGRRIGAPKFKKKGVARDSFCAAVANGKNASVEVDGRWVKLPKLGWVRMRQEVRFNGRIKRATVSREADRWFVTLSVETPDIKPVDAKTKQPACGVDLGVKTLATVYDGNRYQDIKGPKAHRLMLARLRRLSRSLSRKKLGSANRRKAKARLAKLHARIANVRSNALHQLTARLSRGFAVVGIEDLNVSGMLANRRLSRAVADGGFFEFRRQLAYKCEWYGSDLVVANRFYPSSKTCPECGAVNGGLTLAQREWLCPACGSAIERDRGAAKNLREYAVGHTASARGASRL